MFHKLQRTWHYKVNARTGWCSVSVLWLSDIESSICNFCHSVAAHKNVTNLSLIHTCLGVKQATKEIDKYYFYSIPGCVPPLQEVALHQNPPSFSVLCYPCPYHSLLPHNVTSLMTFWSSNWSYTLYLPACASNSPSVIFHSGDVSCTFPFRIGYVLDCVCHSGSLPNDGVTDFVFKTLSLDVKHFPFHGSLACFKFLY